MRGGGRASEAAIDRPSPQCPGPTPPARRPVSFAPESKKTTVTIYCWLSSSANNARPSYVMPGGGKKAVFPPLALHDQARPSHEHAERPKKLVHQSRSKSETKDSPEKEKNDLNPDKHKHKSRAASSGTLMPQSPRQRGAVGLGPPPSSLNSDLKKCTVEKS